MALNGLPKLPVAHHELVQHIAKHPETPMVELMEPYRKFEAQLRKVYAQDRSNPILDDPYLNVLPLFTKDTPEVKTRARDLDKETQEEKDKYIMALPGDKRRANGSPAVVSTLKEFRHNFSVFSESSLSDMDWSNVVAAGSSVVNTILPVPDKYKKSKRTLRQYYHEKFCPASDVDLFLYGLTEDQAIEKIKNIETRVRDAILSETTVVRTKNAITICFDIDCSGAAYDGEQVYCTPRALASYITQINPIDLSRRSPSYENRLSKYSHRNFEVYWPELNRGRVDPTIFERSFQRTLGLARLLVLERLPTTSAREQYLKKRRQERGRPDPGFRYQHRLRGNIKDIHEDEVVDWVDEDEVSNYHTFTVPYGEKFHAKKIEKLCYTKDLLLNAEWNQPKERTVYLHRHPAFFGRVEDVISDCCGTCPQPTTPEEIEVAEKESVIYVSGNVSFRIDDPGRQQIGSFNPLTEDDWTEMAYVGNTARLCQAIVDGDLEHVEDWLSQDGADPNKRDYTGRTPLHLAVISSTPEIVKCLVDHGARLTARLADGQTALHLAAARGNVHMVTILLEKSNINEEEEEEKQDQRRRARVAAHKEGQADSGATETDSDNSDKEVEVDESEGELVDDDMSDDGAVSIATGSFVKVDKEKDSTKKEDDVSLDDDRADPDYYKIDAVAWDSKCSALHLAILGGHCDVVKLLCQEFGADALLPVKIGDGSYSDPQKAILTLVLALTLPVKNAVQMTETLLSLGATSSQADNNGVTAFHRYINRGAPELIESLWANDKIGLKAALNHVAVTGYRWNSEATTPLMTAIDNGDPILVLKLLETGANPEIDFDSWLKGVKLTSEENLGDYESNKKRFRQGVSQPLLVAIESPNPTIAIQLLDRGVDPNVITKSSVDLIENTWGRRYNRGQSALDVVQESLAKLREYRGEKIPFYLPHSNYGYGSTRKTYLEPPKGPFGTSEFLEKFREGTYQHWLVSTDIEDKIGAYKNELDRFEKQKETSEQSKGLSKKKEAIRNAICQLEEVEKALKAKGAKTFRELHPDIEEPPTATDADKPAAPYDFDFNFKGANDITNKRRAAYIELFEAAWTGDLEKIKSLTLVPFDGDEPPLEIAVFDPKGNNPFSLALLKGHFSTAKAILEIAQAQWAPKEEEKARYRMTRNEGADSYESESESDDEPEVYKDIVKDQLTIDNIGQASTQVKSDVPATALINLVAPTFVMLPDGAVKRNKGDQNLLTFSMTENDTERFKFLVEVGLHYASQTPETEEGTSRFFTFSEEQFLSAVKLGRTDMLADMIKRTGAGMPLEDLIKKSGVEMKVKPRYYQGLTVYGKKRADWASKGRNLVAKPTGSKAPPLLIAALKGSRESVEWFLSDTPMRHYLEFGSSKVAKEDPRLKHLSQAPGGFDRAIMRWLGMQNDLVIHCAVMGPQREQTNRLIEYLIKVCPSSVETRSDRGYTPLYLACLLGRVQFAETLIKAGADQSVKDKEYNNIIHAALTNSPKVDMLSSLLSLLDPELRLDMFKQRNQLAHGGDTPLHYWIKKDNVTQYSYAMPGQFGTYSRHDTSKDSISSVELLSLLLEFSKGAELEILNGSGNTVLHSAVLLELPGHMSVILENNAQLLYWENTVGRTPAEIAYDCFIASKLSIGDAVMNIGTGRGERLADLVNKSPFRFACDQPGKPERPRRELVWEVAAEYLALTEGSSKRRLVSLNEANDVAKRISESYIGQRYYQKGTTTSADTDAGDDEEKKKREEEEAAKEADFVTKQYNIKGAWTWAETNDNGMDKDEDHLFLSA
ncbi:hypothetical protein DL766_009476 [Monosporascus sp. MC13-8B]|uniref:Ankyrin repeat protein n=1 Tax=Monosporascus cannonballus TaxID=155416 RepID=A0ABY0GZN7_9PEZI|nr:hypothetical protein DL762_008362 [Monosporascus cannonballus]RYP15177.1 hypothetical protein DL766_009476 [Monosporascus sp. MC13-8B]